MKTSLVQPEDFAVKFGTEHIQEGDFEYYTTDDGLGIIKDITHGTVNTVVPPNYTPKDMNPEDEMKMMALICGNFKKDPPEVPKFKTQEDYLEEEKQSESSLKNTKRVLGGVLSLLALVTVLLLLKISV